MSSGTATVQTAFYEPFGVAVTDTTTVRQKFTGQEYDSEIALYDYGARLYDPVFGRFMSADTVAGGPGPQGLNRYSYALNNPLAYADPSGHSIFSAIGGFLGSVADKIYTYSGNKFVFNAAAQAAITDAAMFVKAHYLYPLITQDFSGFARAQGELAVTAAAAIATGGASKIATSSLVGAVEYTAARGAIGFGSAFGKNLVDGGGFGSALRAGGVAAATSVVFAASSVGYTAMTGTTPLQYGRMSNTIGTKSVLQGDGTIGPEGPLGEHSGILLGLRSIPGLGGTVQGISGPHDFGGGSFGAPGSVVGVDTAGWEVGKTLSRLPYGAGTFINWAVMMPPAAALTGAAIMDRGLVQSLVGLTMLPRTPWSANAGVDSAWSMGF